MVLYSDIIALLVEYKIKMPEQKIVQNLKDAKHFAHNRYPVVLKVLSKDIVHKSDRGVVALGVADGKMLERKYRQIMKNAGKAKLEGVLVQRMIDKGVEVIVGSKTDPQFGPTVLFGLGGIFVEIMKDYSLRIAPIKEKDGLEMMGELKSHQILDGARGQKGINKKALSQLLVNVSKMVSHYEIPQLDLNPVVCTPKSCTVVDARILGVEEIKHRRNKNNH